MPLSPTDPPLTDEDALRIGVLVRRMRATLDVVDASLKDGDHTDVASQLGRVQRLSKDAEMVVLERLRVHVLERTSESS